MKFTQTYRNDLSLDGAVSHFIDYICGELDAYLEDENFSISHSDDTYFSESTFGNGSKYELEIWFDTENGEWCCQAY